MKKFFRSNPIALGIVFGLLALTAIAASNISEDNRQRHTGSVAVTAASQSVETVILTRSTCDSWMFENLDATETIYIQTNSEQGTFYPAAVTYTDMTYLPAGRIIELEDDIIKRFNVIATGNANLYWHCSCK